MSGIEVAGLVLGAFPVAIWVLEEYREVARRYGFWYQIRLEYQRTSNELKFHKICFTRNLKQLLLPLIDDQAQLQRLIAEPAGEAWKDAAVAEALEQRLQDSYGIYLGIMGDMARVMEELKELLAVDDKGVQDKLKEEKKPHARESGGTQASKLPGTFGKTRRDYEKFRIQFSLGEAARTRLFGEFQTYNERLEKLTSTSDIVSKLEADGSSSALSSVDLAMCKFWNHADKLYKTLFAAWRCPCLDQHCAELTLQHRTSADRVFKLHLASRQEDATQQSVFPRRSVKIKMLDRSEKGETQTTSAEPATLFSPQHRIKAPAKTALSAPAARKSRAMAISGAQRDQDSQHSVTVAPMKKKNPTLTTRVSAPSSGTQTAESAIASLCHVLRSREEPLSDCFGFLEDDNMHYFIYSHKGMSNIKSSVTLTKILLGENTPAMTRRQRYLLALTLASSFVQLKDTPWLQTPWNKHGVYISLGSADELLADAPFVLRGFARRTDFGTGTADRTEVRSATGPTQPKLHDQQIELHDVADITSLGIILLELCFGRVLEQHPSRLRFSGCGGSGEEYHCAAFDLFAAMEWLKEVNEEAGSDYAEAVEWCLAHCRTLLPRSGGSWRRQMMEKVVVPLERCYKCLL